LGLSSCPPVPTHTHLCSMRCAAYMVYDVSMRGKVPARLLMSSSPNSWQISLNTSKATTWHIPKGTTHLTRYSVLATVGCLHGLELSPTHHTTAAPLLPLQSKSSKAIPHTPLSVAPSKAWWECQTSSRTCRS
jgi:hypothetical protein